MNYLTPAPGLRGYNNGTLWGVGINGYSWSSTIPSGSIGAYNLTFLYGGVYPNSSNYRAHGLQLRCLQE
ncbi:MAG: hypothetical protein K2G93_05405 [Rikenella sp.]|nr:hypothetical protein [Rikenella sp.]